VTNYYALLPDDTDTAWNLLTRHFQQTKAQGRDGYDSYWGSIDSVSASGSRTTGPRSAQALITYHYQDGRTVSELTAFQFKQQAGVLKIDDTQVLS